MIEQILLWLRKQMSREKDSEDGDRRSLVEEGAAATGCVKKDKAPITQAQWIHQEPTVRTIVPTQGSSSLAEVG